MLKRIALLLAGLAALLAAPTQARVERLTIHSEAIAGNLEGNSPDRTVYVILPDSYDTTGERRYPVLYFLHGFTSTAQEYLDYIPFDAALQASGRDLIVVVPDTLTKWGGSFYSDSPTVGNFESFIASDLVHRIDADYRTLADRGARGIAGHSMGGYGAIRLGMKRPEVFGALYAMNPCCTLPRLADPTFESWTQEQALAATGVYKRGYFAMAAAWSPNPGKPPFHADLATSDGKPDPLVLAQWAANAPVAMAPQYLPALQSLHGIAIDTGDTDFVRVEGEAIHRTLLKFGVVHDWELYTGDHGNKVPERFAAKVQPFFAKHLKGAAG